jgi:cyclopropane-fatty-acyl-phospholipid synthase
MAHDVTHHVEFHWPSPSWPLWRVLRAVIQSGNLKVRDWRGEVRRFGDGTGKLLALRFLDERAQRAFLLDPQLAFPEAYMDGQVEMEAGALYDLLSLFAQNLNRRDFPFWMRAADGFRRATRMWRQANDPGGAKRNAVHHYDLPDALYELFLDENRQYSCAYFATGAESLDDAQLAKMRLIAKKLCLRTGQRVLDIGCGWGGLSLHLAREAHAKVLGITLSREQESYASARASEAKSCEVSFRLLDYRALAETYDRIISVGMFEHVGLPNYLTFFKTMNACLKEDGVALLHTIGRLSGPSFTNAFIAKYIFPGGYIPALSEIVPAIEESGLLVTDIEVLRGHYAKTLAAWRRNFENAWSKAASIMPERFCRMWEYYLAASEVGFRYQNLAVFQIQLAKKADAAPPTRDYLCSA